MERGYTYAKKNTVLYEWEIGNISSLIKEQMEEVSIYLPFKSSKFSTGAKIQDKWQILLIMNDGSAILKYRDWIDIYINNLSGHDVTANVDIFIANLNGERIFQVNSFSKKFEKFDDDDDAAADDDDEEDDDKYWNSNAVIMKKDLFANNSELIPNDVLTLRFEITVTDDKTIIPFKRSLGSSKSDMAIDYNEIYKSSAFSDVTIIIGDVKLQAHRIILMARSPVLAALFTHTMIEKKTNEVTITDITSETFEKLLEYIYTDEVSNLTEVAADLLVAADKYQMNLLKKRCEESLCESLNLDNVIQMMVLADRHNAQVLMEYVTKCITADALNVIETEDFKDYERSNPSLVSILFRNLAAEKVNARTKITYSTLED